MTKMIIVTGGAGFIGSGLIRKLNDKGLDQIVVVDDLGSSDKWKNLVKKKFLTIISKYDLFDWLEGKEKEIHTIFHMGACSSTVEKDADYLLDNNYRYSVQLAEYALNNHIPFIYASSAATYGDGSKGFVDDHHELDNLEPLNMYGFSKHLFDLWLKQNGVLQDVVGLKFFNVFGPNEAHKGRMASTLFKWKDLVLNDQPIELFKSDTKKFADGEQKRDFIYVKDAVNMILAFFDDPKGGIFNIGSGNATSWNALAYAMFEAVGKKPKINYIDMPKDLVGKYQNYTCADMEKTRKAIGNKALITPFKEAVSDYMNNHLIPNKTW